MRSVAQSQYPPPPPPGHSVQLRSPASPHHRHPALPFIGQWISASAGQQISDTQVPGRGCCRCWSPPAAASSARARCPRRPATRRRGAWCPSPARSSRRPRRRGSTTRVGAGISRPREREGDGTISKMSNFSVEGFSRPVSPTTHLHKVKEYRKTS